MLLIASSCGTPTETTASNSGRCRILYIIGQLGWGGSERQLSYLLRELDRKRYPPALLVWNYSPDQHYIDVIRSLSVPIHFFPQDTSSAAKLKGVRRLAQSLGAEVIHSCSFYTNFPAYWAALKTSAVAVGSLRGEFDKGKKDSGPLLGRLSARWPRYQIYNSVSSAEMARRSGGMFSPKHIDVVRNGLDLQQFCVLKGNSIVEEYIVGIGSLLSLKRWDRVLRIVNQVRRRGAECKVRIAGDGPERRRLERQAQDLGISEHVEFLGSTLDVRQLLEKSRFLVHTSDSEGCPNAVMEAMACGRPVVAMDAGDIPLLVEDGKTGFVIREGDEETFEKRVVLLLSDDDLCHRMGLAARVKAERELGLDHLVTCTLDAYRTAGWKDTHSAHSQAELIRPR
jgi:glycosyltransferase involved in cell wall biosynthesis